MVLPSILFPSSFQVPLSCVYVYMSYVHHVHAGAHGGQRRALCSWN